MNDTEHRIVSTEEFWKKMCDFRFARIDKHSGAIGNTVYHVAAPPENIHGFLEDKISATADFLRTADTALARAITVLRLFPAMLAVIAMLVTYWWLAP